MRSVCNNRQLAALGYFRFFLLLVLTLFPVWSGAAPPRMTDATARKLRAIYLKSHKYLTPEQAQIGFCSSYGFMNAKLQKEATERIRRAKGNMFFAIEKNYGNTPLDSAAAMADVEMIGALLKKGVPVDGIILPEDSTFATGMTPLMRAIYGATGTWAVPAPQRIQAIDMLVKAGADLRLKDNKGTSAMGYVLGLSIYNDNDKMLRENIAQLLIEAGADPNEVTKTGGDDVFGIHRSQTVLSLAVAAGMQKAVHLLLEHGADPKAQHSIALAEAIHARQNELAILLIQNGADPNAFALMSKRSVLADAVLFGQTAVVSELIRHGARKDACLTENEKGECMPDGGPGSHTTTVMQVAQEGGQSDMVNVLLSENAAAGKPAIAARNDATSMMWQALLREKRDMTICVAGTNNCRKIIDNYDKTSVVRTALRQGADPNATMHDMKPLDVVPDDNTELITLLLDNGARWEGMDYHGEQIGPISAALAQHKYFLAGELLRRVQGSLGTNEQSAMLFAVADGRSDMVKLLLLRGADINQGGVVGESPLHVAVENGSLQMVRLLLGAGADPDRKTKSHISYRVDGLLHKSDGAIAITNPEITDWEMTPLMLAAFHGNLAIAQELIGRGANRGLRSEGGKTALDFAQEMGETGMVAMLSGRKPASANPASRLLDQASGQPMGGAWVAVMREKCVGIGHCNSFCVEVHAVKTSSTGVIPEKWWDEHQQMQLGAIYKPGQRVTWGGARRGVDGQLYFISRASDNPADSNDDARLSSMSSSASNVMCGSASYSQRKDLIPMYKEMIAEAASLAKTRQQIDEVQSICNDLYWTSLESPFNADRTVYPPKHDLLMKEFLQAEAPACLEMEKRLAQIAASAPAPAVLQPAQPLNAGAAAGMRIQPMQGALGAAHPAPLRAVPVQTQPSN